MVSIAQIWVGATAVVVGLAARPTIGAECHDAPSPSAEPNLLAIETAPPVLAHAGEHAKLYMAGSLPILHLWGTPYQMGYAQGALRNESVTALINGVWDYLVDQAASSLNGTKHHLKPAFAELIANVGLEAALEATLDVTRAWTGDYFAAELQGLADATSLPLKKIEHIHMIGELTKGSCSLYGAWGNATAQAGGSLMQLRALDWDVTGPFKNHPQITVYHPAPGAGNGHAFANVGWSGFIGAITGISSVQMAISEIGVSFPDASFGRESRFGVPFTYLLRDILQFDESLSATETHLKDARRTCDLIFGVGDGKSSTFRSVQYSASVANFFDDDTMQPTADWHPRVNDLVYYGMDWLCPTFTTVLHKQLLKHYGNITAENTIRDVVPIVQTGDLHIAIYDLTNMVMHVSTARPDTEPASNPALAYNRAFTRLEMGPIFAETLNY